MCGITSDERDLKSLPLQIAKGSKCSCGHSLRLGDHSFHQNGDSVEFVAIYECPQCGKMQKGARVLLSALAALWSDISEIKVGATGFIFKKRTSRSEPKMSRSNAEPKTSGPQPEPKKRTSKKASPAK
jgi:hypothetical protein